MTENKTEPFICCDEIVKLFKADDVEVFALQGLELSIEKGELMAIIGKSGSGKSTLLNIIGGLEKPSAGKIMVEGRNLGDMSEKEMTEYRKHKVGFVWQKSSRNLFPYLTVIDNVIMAMSFEHMSSVQKRREAVELLDMVGILHKKNSYPLEMSGGEQQRAAIAVALANKPDILLADEPTGAVDSKTSNMIQGLFRQLNHKLGITIIIVTHDLGLADKVDRVVMISDGKISTEKIMKQQYRSRMQQLLEDEQSAQEIFMEESQDIHQEYSVLDKANRLQLSKEMLEEAGIDSKRVRVSVENGKIVIS